MRAKSLVMKLTFPAVISQAHSFMSMAQTSTKIKQNIAVLSVSVHMSLCRTAVKRGRGQKEYDVIIQR